MLAYCKSPQEGNQKPAEPFIIPLELMLQQSHAVTKWWLQAMWFAIHTACQGSKVYDILCSTVRLSLFELSRITSVWLASIPCDKVINQQLHITIVNVMWSRPDSRPGKIIRYILHVSTCLLWATVALALENLSLKNGHNSLESQLIGSRPLLSSTNVHG